MKIVLIRPSIDYQKIPAKIKKFFPPPTGNYFKELPMGILYVASACLKRGIETKIIDQYVNNLSNKEVLGMLEKENPNFVGFSLTSLAFENSIILAKNIKKKIKNCRIVAGGPWASLRRDKILEYREFDYVIYGEGEITLPQLLKKFSDQKKLYSINGLIFRQGNKVIINKPREFIKNLDAFPFPARDIININDYSRGRSFYVNSQPVDYLQATRGCPYSCTFCSSSDIWHRSYRMRDPVKIVDEMVYLINHYGSRGFHFSDDNLTVNKKFVINLCQEIIKRKINLPWVCISRVDTLDEEVVRMMKKAGCTGMWFGLESGSQEILDFLKKGTTLNKIKKTIKLCQKYKMKLGGSFMLGVPIETSKTIKETVKLAWSLNLTNSWFNYFVGIPNCELYQRIKENKWYKYKYCETLIVQTPNFTCDQMYDLCRRYNLLFELKRLDLIIKTHHFSEYPKMLYYLVNSLWFLIKAQIKK